MQNDNKSLLYSANYSPNLFIMQENEKGIKKCMIF